ncbi:GatB/YqeY domain-containing protein [Bernardetia sp. MNP-M8]|uniref:GatB/YqeY domain-containing protein n=1 Tax=Bernardetia sp. MNP-M8 TaxID=3127470 RepID=UPI0030CF7D9C
MTTLKEKVESEMKVAMRAKETTKLTALRAIKSAILLAQTEKGSTSESLSEQQELDILLKQAKQRRESLALYEQEGRTELAETEKAELEVIEKFLPQMLSEDEVKIRVEKILAGMGEVTPQQMGQVMGAAIKELGTEAEKQTIAKVVKELINK